MFFFPSTGIICEGVAIPPYLHTLKEGREGVGVGLCFPSTHRAMVFGFTPTSFPEYYITYTYVHTYTYKAGKCVGGQEVPRRDRCPPRGHL